MGILDEFVMRAALIDARRHVSRGLSIDEAVRTSCTGAWHSCRAEVAQRLRAESTESHAAKSMDEQAA